MALVLALASCALTPAPRPRPPRPFDFRRDVGLVFVKGGDSAVLHHASPSVAPNTAVLIVLPRERQVVHATITGERPPREEYVQRPFGPDIRTRRVMLKVTHGKDLMPALGIAIIGRAAAVRTEGGQVEAELDGVAPPEAFRECASSEGAHLTIWSGAPLVGRRRWHAYYYVGYDTALDCTPGDWGQAPASIPLK